MQEKVINQRQSTKDTDLVIKLEMEAQRGMDGVEQEDGPCRALLGPMK